MCVCVCASTRKQLPFPFFLSTDLEESSSRSAISGVLKIGVNYQRGAGRTDGRTGGHLGSCLRRACQVHAGNGPAGLSEV